MAVQGPWILQWLTRWRTYLRERYPPLKYAVALGLFSTTSLVCVRAARGLALLPAAYPWAAGFTIVFLLFLQLRILDEFKDQVEDARYRPQLPVPRGVVSLRALGWLWLVAAALQFALAAGLGLRAVAMLVLVLAYSGLMRIEFFVRDWLRAHPLAYLLSHMVVVPLAALMLACGESAPDELVAVRGPLLAYLGFGYLNFCVFELGRKTRAPAQEVAGVDTYSARWGCRNAALAWAASLWCAAAAGAATAQALGAGWPFTLAALLLAAGTSVQALRFMRDPAATGGGVFVAASTLWFVGAHAALIAALVLMRA